MHQELPLPGSRHQRQKHMRCIRCSDIQWVSDDIDDEQARDGKIHGQFANTRHSGCEILRPHGPWLARPNTFLHHGDVSDDVVQVQRLDLVGHAGKMSLIRIDRRNILREMIKINFGKERDCNA